ncbi:MAG: hypothetical protein IKI02_06495 [Oscillospiraceae bacterium]|nr:hypothetical protein [Oscillospiraceae bacterium]
MSASASKKKRKELEEQGLSAYAIAEKKAKEKKSKTLRNVLIVALAAVVCCAAVFGVIALVNRPDYDTKAPVFSVGDEKVTVPVYDYFYNLTASNFYNSYSFIIESGKPLSQQKNIFGEGTMEDMLKDNTNDSLGEILNVVAKAKAENYELSSEQKANIASGLASVKNEAQMYGMSVDKYLAARFGSGCDLDSYEEYLNLYMTYSGYASKLSADFQPSAEELKAEYEKDTSVYDLVSFTYATSAAESTKVGEKENTEKEPEDTAPASTEDTAPASTEDTAPASTEDTAPAATGETAPAATEDTAPAATTPASTETVYTDEAKAAAKEKAEAYAKEMPEDASTVSYNKENAKSYLTEEIANWLFEEGRKEGDVKVFARDDKETFYYTVRFDSRDTNDYCLVNANIITIQKDKESDVASKDEKNEGEQKEETLTAKQKFEALTAAVKEGMSDEDFNKTVTDLNQGYSTNVNPITRTYSMKEIREWLYAEGRKAGDLLTSYETDTAYYLVRFVSTEEETYRDTLVKNHLWNDYYDSIAKAKEYTVDQELLKNAFTDLSFQSNTNDQG